MSEEPVQVEATGETVGEAKWHALRELERLAPGLDKSAVRFEVLSEGERGLLGVGYAPARVLATADVTAAPAVASAPAADASALAADIQDLLERITDGIGVRCRVDVTEDDETVTASLEGGDLGLLIGRHGQTIDAVQYLVNAVAYRTYGDDRKGVVVDAAGYRERRRATLESLALRSAEQAKATGEPVELEPMTSIERRIVHVRLQDEPGVSTTSEGEEPYRYVVVEPDYEGTGFGLSLETWLERLLATPGLTAIRDPAEARRVHLDESLIAVPHVERFPGTIVDVGSGGGAPGIPVAAALPGREVVLLESNGRKCDFLESVAAGFPNVRVVRGRAEEQETDRFGVALAKALAPPPVAVEWCLPLVAPGGAAILLVGPSADAGAVARAAAQLGGGEPEEHPGVLVVPKVEPTPPGFPRRPGVARKRPLS